MDNWWNVTAVDEEYPNVVIEWHDGAFGGVEKGFEPNEEDLLAGWEIRNGMLPDVEITGNIFENNDQIVKP